MKIKLLENETETPKRVCLSYIRVSSTRQSTDDKSGISRQMLIAPRVVAAHPGWVLDEKLNLADLGVSGYGGKNIAIGNLGGLVEALKAGKIPTGRIMILEALDRLTRNEVDQAYDLVRDILRAGMEIYDDKSGKLYTKESLKNITDLLILILTLSAGNEYSEKLSERIKAAWNKKKKEFVKENKAYRQRCPHWLKWNKSMGIYEPIPANVANVKRMFDLALQGYGYRTIAATLNREKATRTYYHYDGRTTKKNKWSPIVIHRIVMTKMVLGYNENFDPARLMYPAVIDENLYYKARAIVDTRKTNKWYGRTNDGSNLFSSICKCPLCKESYILWKRKEWRPKEQRKLDREPYSYSYLKCLGSVRGECKNWSLHYDRIEESFFAVMLDAKFRQTIVEKVYGDQEQSNPVDVLRGQLADTKKRLARYADDYEKEPSDTLRGIMSKAELEQRRLLKDIDDTIMTAARSTPAGESYKSIIDLITPKEDGDASADWDAPETRLKIRNGIRTLVDKIVANGKQKSYDVYLRSGDAPIHVEMTRKGFTIDDGPFMYFSGSIAKRDAPPSTRKSAYAYLRD